MADDDHNAGGEPAPGAGGGGFLKTLLSTARSHLAAGSFLRELNGAMGDLGTYIPIVLSLALARGLDLGTTLVFTGAFNVLTGALYGVPMPVQPMKSIAAVALADPGFGVPEIMAAGILTSGFVFFLGATQLMRLVYWLVPLPVVRGIQLAQGLSFAMAAVNYIENTQSLSTGKALGSRPWLGLDGIVLAIAALCFILLVNGAGVDHQDEDQEEPRRGRRSWKKIVPAIPSAVLVFVLGVALAIVRRPSALAELRAGPATPAIVRITAAQWRDGFVKGALPQIPLSILNSVVGVCKLSKDLFPSRAASATSVSLTVGAMNLVGCWFGAMPSCHGAGGLAGQYKFGGRSGASVAILGAAKFALGVALGGSVLRVLAEFPVGLLGVLLGFAGVELAMAARDMATKKEAFVVVVVTAVSLVGSNAALGFACGMVAHGLLLLRDLLLK